MRCHCRISFPSLLSVALTAALLLSCNRNTIWHGYQDVSERGWYRGDTLLLCIPSLESAGTYLEELEFRTSTRYPFKRLRLVVDQTIYHTTGTVWRDETHSDTITCNIYDSDGQPLGDGLDLYQFRVPFRQLTLQEGDSLHLLITHGMQRTSLTGVTDVGIRLSRP